VVVVVGETVNDSLALDELLTVPPFESVADQLPVPSVNVTVKMLLSPVNIELGEAETVTLGKGLLSQRSTFLGTTLILAEGGSVE
jgi:hypothetical protein